VAPRSISISQDRHFRFLFHVSIPTRAAGGAGRVLFWSDRSVWALRRFVGLAGPRNVIYLAHLASSGLQSGGNLAFSHTACRPRHGRAQQVARECQCQCQWRNASASPRPRPPFRDRESRENGRAVSGRSAHVSRCVRTKRRTKQATRGRSAPLVAFPFPSYTAPYSTVSCCTGPCAHTRGLGWRGELHMRACTEAE